MDIIVRLDMMLARRKMRSRELADLVGISEQNIGLL
jgi:putative transcriptional regulator